MNKGELVAIAPSGALVVLIPIYTRNIAEELCVKEGYSFHLITTEESPVGYILDWEETGDQCRIFGKDILDSLEVLGEL
jgi:hypothetical protein